MPTSQDTSNVYCFLPRDSDTCSNPFIAPLLTLGPFYDSDFELMVVIVVIHQPIDTFRSPSKIEVPVRYCI